jgi:Ca2+-binding RTX toxin-like protein
LDGGEGGDVLIGGSGNDLLLGGDGDDLIFVSRGGHDSADGGAGSDSIVISLASGGVEAVPLNRIAGPALGYLTDAQGAAGQAPVLQNRFEVSDAGALIVMDGNFTPLMTATSMENLQIRSSVGQVLANVAIVTGTASDDTLDTTATSGQTIVIGAQGDDTITLNAAGSVAMGGGGNDILRGGDGNDGLYGGAGDDLLEGGRGNDWLVGGAGNDTLIGGDGVDSAGFYIVPGGSQNATVTISGYDSAIGGFKVMHGSDVRASLVWNTSAQTWTVTDLSGASFGVDTVSGVEFLTFDPFIAGVSALTVDVATLIAQLPGDSDPRSFEFQYLGDRYEVTLSGLTGFDLKQYPMEYEVSRFMTVAAVFRNAAGDGRLRVIDLETGTVLAGRALAQGEFLVPSSDADTLFHIGQRTDQTLTIRSFDYGLTTSDGAVSGDPVSQQTLILPAGVASLTIDQYIPAQGTQAGFLSVWVDGAGGGRRLFSLNADGQAVQIDLPPGVNTSAWIGNGFVLDGALWVSAFQQNQGSFYRRVAGGWETVSDAGDFFDVRDFVIQAATVARDGIDALDLMPLVSAGQVARVFYEDRVERLPDGSLLVRGEVVDLAGDTDHEIWVVRNSEGIVSKQFDSAVGFGLRSVFDRESGFVYFQQLNVSMDESSGQLSQTDPAVTLYRIAVADVRAALADASDGSPLDSLAAAQGVVSLGSYTRSQLSGGRTLAATDIVLLEAFFPGSIFSPTDTGALALHIVYDQQADLDSWFFTRIEANGTVTRFTPLSAEIDDVVVDPSNGVFILTEQTDTQAALAFHVNPATAVLSQISVSLFDSIAANGGIPANVTFTPGTDSADTVDKSAETGRQWIAGGNGSDVLSGGAGNDNLYGGPGNDTITGGAGNDVLSGMGGDDRLRGGSGSDIIYGGAGSDRIQYNSPGEMIGDTVTGTNVFWNGPGSALNGGDSQTLDRIQLRGSGTYDFAAVGASFSYIDRVDVVTNLTLAGVEQTAPFEIVLTAALAASADANGDGQFGDIAVVGYNGTNDQATTVDVSLDASALGANQSVRVLGQVGSGVSGAAAFGGLSGNDTLLGGAGNDILNSGAGNDVITGGRGNDTIDGGDGIDLAVYVGPLDDYSVQFDTANGVLILTHDTAGGDGVDIVRNVERFQFADLFYVLNDSGQLVPEPPAG